MRSHITKYFLDESKIFLKTTHSLATGPNEYLSDFGFILESVFRKDYFTLQTIIVLMDKAEHDPEQEPIFASSILDLSRRVLEDMINVEYIFLKGKKKYTKQFIDFKAVDDKRDLDFLKKNGVTLDPDLVNKIEEAYEEAPKKLKEKGRNSWTKVTIKQMIEHLVEKKVMSLKELEMLSMTYVFSCRKNHTSPSDILSYSNQEGLDAQVGTDLGLGLTVILSSIIKVARLLLLETKSSESLKASIEEHWKKLNVRFDTIKHQPQA